MPLKGQYRYGSIALTNGSKSVVGSNTSWADNATQGNLIAVIGEGVYYEVDSVTDDTHLTLKTAYAGSTAAGANYAIQRDFTQYNGYALPSYGDTETVALLQQALTAIDAQLAQVAPVLTGLVGGTLQMSGTLQIEGLASDAPILPLANANLSGNAPASFAGFKVVRATPAPSAFLVWNEADGAFAAYTSPDDLATPTLATIEAATFKGTLASTSDARLKKPLGIIDRPLERLFGIRGQVFEWNDRALKMGLPTGRNVGVMAQDVEKVLPEAVIPGTFLSVNYQMLIPLMIEAIRELSGQNSMLQARIDMMEASSSSSRVV